MRALQIPVELFAPLAPVTLPTGREAAVFPITNAVKRVLRERGAQLTDQEARAIFRVIMPDLTEDEWDALTERQAAWILALAGEKSELAEQIVEDARKNASGGTRENASGIPPSSPTTPSPTCAPESPEPIPAAVDIGPSRAKHTTKPSSLSTRSRKSSESTSSSPTLTP